ncbi:hypothetical protein BDY21DRAFT_397727 [Lineolata rhizophorae]|uniref:Uncharacterized protein n=1 Tax=Lineolata rhizophorae TaxID=578093 RepID=A0A6A6PC68_9PEZI|nr:hypothetical protein BDY21DRAFT_397727 [Lineolata rhizophorae]
MSSPPSTPTLAPTRSTTTSPRHARHPSSLDLGRSLSGAAGPPSPSSRRSSAAYSPVTPRSAHFRSGSIGELAEVGSNGGSAGRGARGGAGGGSGSGGGGGGGGDGGLGSLADELADAWEGDEEEGEEEYDEEGADGSDADDDDGRDGRGAQDRRGTTPPEQSTPINNGFLSPVAHRNGKHHRRKRSIYDGSDYGEDSDLEASEGISAGLEARMAAVESLARRGLDESGTPADGVVGRVTDMLRELGSQAGVEGGATRLTTAHTALATHLSHQTRLLTSLTSTLLLPAWTGGSNAPSPPGTTPAALTPADADALLPLLSDALAALPQPPTAPLFALHALSTSTADLAAALSALSDSLHMSRQATAAAGRRLRTVTDALREWRRERDRRDEGVRWIERGGWDGRIAGRWAGAVCGEVVGGFEEVCEGWRERILAGAGGGTAAAAAAGKA